MNLWIISWNYIRNKGLNTSLNSILLALGVGIIVFLLLVQTQLNDKFRNDIQGIKMVVGAKGSPLQLILSNVYHIDVPTGNIPLSEANQIINNRFFVKSSIPLSLGDSYKGFRIVGTDTTYPAHYGMELAEGRLWNTSLEVVIGTDVAQYTGLRPGDSFLGAHGLVSEEDVALEHEEHAYTVVGIFKASNTVLDKLILSDLKSIWQVHEKPDEVLEEASKEDSLDNQEHPADLYHDTDSVDHGIDHPTNTYAHTDSLVHKDHEALDKDEEDLEITALLITEYANPLAAINLPLAVNQIGRLQAASPALEINRLFALIGIGEQALQAFALIIILIATLSVFIALYNALKERKYDLAVMRTLGASKTKLFAQILLEGIILAGMGALLGITLGHLTVYWISGLEAVSDKIKLNASLFLIEELWIFLATLGAGVLAALIPAFQVYSIDISKTLSQ